MLMYTYVYTLELPVSLHTFILFRLVCDIIFIGFYLMMKRKNSTSKKREKKTSAATHTDGSRRALSASVNFDVVTRTTSVRGQRSP